MLKEKITFEISHLKSLLESDNSCVRVVNNFKGKLSLLPFHLGYLKHAVKELLDEKVSKYDPELNGIVLGHSNIKVINYLQHSDSFRIHLNYLADIYLFTPAVGKNLTGIINKKSNEHIGCLIHTAFNASIPKPRNLGGELSIWLRTHGSLQIGNELEFTVAKVDFASRVPYISGVIVRNESDHHEDECDSGVSCHDSLDDLEKKPKKKKRKSIASAQTSFETNEQNEVTSYFDLEQISELLNSNTQPAKVKKIKSEKLSLDDSNNTPTHSKKIKKENVDLDVESGSSTRRKDKYFQMNSNDENFPMPIEKIKKERLSVTPTNMSPLTGKKSKRHSQELNETFNLDKVKSESSVDELSDLLLKEAMDNCFSPKYSDASTSSESGKKKKKKKDKNITYDQVDLPVDKIKIDSSPPDLNSFHEFKELSYLSPSTSDAGVRKTKKRKRSESPIKSSESEDISTKKSKKKKLKKSADSLELLTSSLLAELGDGGMTWMGWAPQTGMTAFASSANPWPNENRWKNTNVELEPPPAQDTAASEPEEQDQPPKKWNKPRYDDDEDRPSSSKAEASLNAWFPIMLGLFPPQGEDSRKQPSDQGWEKAKSIAAVANSVNHGSRGVASSHAVAFGGEPPNYRSRTWNRNLDSKDKNVPESNGNGAQTQPKPQPYYKPLQRYANTSY